jgi:hypothetical protein
MSWLLSTVSNMLDKADEATADALDDDGGAVGPTLGDDAAKRVGGATAVTPVTSSVTSAMATATPSPALLATGAGDQVSPPSSVAPSLAVAIPGPLPEGPVADSVAEVASRDGAVTAHGPLPSPTSMSQPTAVTPNAIASTISGALPLALDPHVVVPATTATATAAVPAAVSSTPSNVASAPTSTSIAVSVLSAHTEHHPVATLATETLPRTGTGLSTMFNAFMAQTPTIQTGPPATSDAAVHAHHDVMRLREQLAAATTELEEKHNEVTSLQQVWNETRQKLQKMQQFVVQQNEQHQQALAEARGAQAGSLEDVQTRHRQEVIRPFLSHPHTKPSVVTFVIITVSHSLNVSSFGMRVMCCKRICR